MRLRFKNRSEGVVDILGTDLSITHIEGDDYERPYWVLETTDHGELMMDTSLASMKRRVQALYETLGRLWVQ